MLTAIVVLQAAAGFLPPTSVGTLHRPSPSSSTARSLSPVLFDDIDSLPEPDAQQRLRLQAMQAKNQRNGAAVLSVILLIVVWFFSVPPSIRRADVCASELEMMQRGCISPSALLEQVQTHYSTCGGADGAAGVQFDFSIDPKSRAAFDAQLRELQGGS